MAKRLTLVALLALVLAAAFWRQARLADRAEWDAGLAASRTLSATFARTGVLEVARLSGEAVTRVEGRSGFGVFGNVQTTRAPYSVEYRVDLCRLTRADYRWNRAARVMTVTIPAVTVGQPSVDLAQARTEQAGFYISRQSGVAMERHVAANLAAAAGATASAPQNLTQAQSAAREAVARLVAAPLEAAGLTGVRVVVRLPGEARPAGFDRRQWDMSRPIADVLNE